MLRRRTRRTVGDSERDWAAEKAKRDKEEDEDSEPHGTPDNDSDSATTEKTQTKTKNDKIRAVEEKLMKTNYTNKGPHCWAV